MATQGILFESRSTRALAAALDALVQRQNVIADNVANADTPGFQAKDVEFQVHLDALLGKERGPRLARTHVAHFASRDAVRLLALDRRHITQASPVDEPQLSLADAVTTSNDGSSVEIEGEMVKLAETQLAFATFARLLSGRIESARLLARDGR